MSLMFNTNKTKAKHGNVEAQPGAMEAHLVDTEAQPVNL
jgi:hypothetical protein